MLPDRMQAAVLRNSADRTAAHQNLAGMPAVIHTPADMPADRFLLKTDLANMLEELPVVPEPVLPALPKAGSPHILPNSPAVFHSVSLVLPKTDSANVQMPLSLEVLYSAILLPADYLTTVIQIWNVLPVA